MTQPQGMRKRRGKVSEDGTIGTRYHCAVDSRGLVLLMVIIDSLYYISARLLLPHVPPAAGAMYMMLVGAVAIVLGLRGRIDWGVLGRRWRIFLTVGILVGLNTNMGFVVVRYLDPGTASLLSRTAIVFGVALGLVWLKETLTGIEALGALVAITGVVVVSFQPGNYLRFGSLISVVATLLYSTHSAVVKRYAGDIPLGDFLFFRVAATSAVLVVLVVVQGALVWPSPVAWGWLIAAALVNIVISRGLYYLILRRVDMTYLVILSTLTPALTWVWSIVLFGGRPRLQEILGGAVTLAGVLVVTASRSGLLRRPS